MLQWHPDARILIAGQAPGRRVHASGLPFDDPSGERLRDWLGVDKTVFYDETRIAILPMAFCYPGTGKSGDLPPPPQCAAAWRQPLLAGLPHLQLTILLGQYAQRYHLPGRYPRLTEAVERWREHWPALLPLPHPSPRNQPGCAAIPGSRPSCCRLCGSGWRRCWSAAKSLFKVCCASAGWIEMGVETKLKMLMYHVYIPLFRSFSPCLALARETLNRL